MNSPVEVFHIPLLHPPEKGIYNDHEVDGDHPDDRDPMIESVTVEVDVPNEF